MKKTTEIPISMIKANAQQPRKAFGEEQLLELRDSIKEFGVLQPLILKKDEEGGYLLIAGERRLRAAAMAGLEKVALLKKEVRANIIGYMLPNGRTVNIIGEGKLVNIAAADGHPAEIMDLSFAVQAMSALYIKENHDKLENKVIDVSDEIDDAIARKRLKVWNIEIDSLTEEQERYLNSWQL